MGFFRLATFAFVDFGNDEDKLSIQWKKIVFLKIRVGFIYYYALPSHKRNEIFEGGRPTISIKINVAIKRRMTRFNKSLAL